MADSWALFSDVFGAEHNSFKFENFGEYFPTFFAFPPGLLDASKVPLVNRTFGAVIIGSIGKRKVSCV